MRRVWIVAAAVNGLAAVAVGAAAQHLWAGDPHRVFLSETAVRYGLPHAAVLLTLAAIPVPTRRLARALLTLAGICLAVGTTLFAGSLFALVAEAPTTLAMVTPVGGSLMILGWGLLLAFGVALGRDR